MKTRSFNDFEKEAFGEAEVAKMDERYAAHRAGQVKWIEALEDFPAWKLGRNEQPWSDGTADVIYWCSICDGENWTETEYGATKEEAVEQALAQTREIRVQIDRSGFNHSPKVD